MKTISKLWMWIGALIALSPLSLMISEYFKASGAWGEWEAAEVQELVDYIPAGLKRLSSLWSAPLPDYTFQGWEEKSLAGLSLTYILSGVIGILVCVGVVFVIGKFLSKK